MTVYEVIMELEKLPFDTEVFVQIDDKTDALVKSITVDEGQVILETEPINPQRILPRIVQ